MKLAVDGPSKHRSVLSIAKPKPFEQTLDFISIYLHSETFLGVFCYKAALCVHLSEYQAV